MQNEPQKKPKETISFSNLPNIIVVVTFIVGIGAVFGLLGYLVSGIKENITPVAQKPSVKITDDYFGNDFIQVKSPQKNAIAKNPVLISGKANVDEANVRVKITDDNENILVDTFITADGWMDKLYPFEKEISYGTPQTENGLIEIFEESARDGSEIYKIEVPVVFEDYDIINKSLILLDAWKICEKNSDCVETQPDCCGCSGGGIQIAINKEFIDLWEMKIKNACRDISCIAVYTCKPGYPACVNNVCEYVEVSDEDCAKEGEFVNPESLRGKTDYSDACCIGLKGLRLYRVDEKGDCEGLIGTPYLTCMLCGDGACDIDTGENLCNCPEDCLSQIPECRGLYEDAREECECVALDGWWNIDRCYSLTTDSGKSCTDSGECEGQCLGDGWESTSGKCGKWAVEKGCHYVLLNGKVNFASGC